MKVHFKVVCLVLVVLCLVAENESWWKRKSRSSRRSSSSSSSSSRRSSSSSRYRSSSSRSSRFVQVVLFELRITHEIEEHLDKIHYPKGFSLANSKYLRYYVQKFCFTAWRGKIIANFPADLTLSNRLGTSYRIEIHFAVFNRLYLLFSFIKLVKTW